MKPALVGALIERGLAFAGGTHTVDDVLKAVDEGTLQLWVGEHSVMVTQIQQYPQLRELQFFLAAGRMEEIKQLYPTILSWGRSQQCQRAVFVGRPGWSRSFLTRDEGWGTTMQVFEKEL